MLKNSLTNQILKVQRIDTNNNSCTCFISNDIYAKNSQNIDIHVIDLWTRLNTNLGESAITKFQGIINECESSILTLSDYSDWKEFNGIEEWIDDSKLPQLTTCRFYVTNDQIRYLTKNYFEMVSSLFTNPQNPTVDFSEGELIYIFTLADDSKQLLESLGINIEYKPIN